MKLIAALGFAAALAGGVMSASLAASADSFTPEQKQDLGAIIHDYLVNNPETLREAIEALDKHDKAAAADAREKVVTSQSGPLFNSKYQATIGAPTANATLVEFFDYNCHYCKGALPDVTRLLKDDPNLKVVLKDFPVLGPGSVEAAKVAAAVRNQLPGDKFWAFHTKLLATHGPVGKAEALAVAKDLGLDMNKLAKDMESPDVQAGLDENMKLADALQINGTPTFVLGQDLVVGAVGYDDLKSKVDSVHKCGRVTC
jgi:protein-disulfide isomerase